jgi:hypothetical protein
MLWAGLSHGRVRCVYSYRRAEAAMLHCRSAVNSKVLPSGVLLRVRPALGSAGSWPAGPLQAHHHYLLEFQFCCNSVVSRSLAQCACMPFLGLSSTSSRDSVYACAAAVHCRCGNVTTFESSRKHA